MFLAMSSLRPLAKTLLAVGAFSLNFLHDSTLFVIDIHQNMPISLILTPFDHFQICPTFAVTPNLILEPCPMFIFLFSSFSCLVSSRTSRLEEKTGVPFSVSVFVALAISASAYNYGNEHGVTHWWCVSRGKTVLGFIVV